MSTSHMARAPRQAAILATIGGLHIGAFVLAVAGLGPRLDWLQPAPPTFIYAQPEPPLPAPLAPPEPGPLDYAPAAPASSGGADPRFRTGAKPAGSKEMRRRNRRQVGDLPSRPWMCAPRRCANLTAGWRHSSTPAIRLGIAPAERGGARRRPGRRRCRRPRERLERRRRLRLRTPRCRGRVRDPPAGIQSGTARWRGRGGERAAADRVPAALIGSAGRGRLLCSGCCR